MRAFSTVLFVLVLALGAFAQSSAATQTPASATPDINAEAGNYLQLDAAELIQHAATLSGRRVALTAEIVSLNARRQMIEVYDEVSHKVVAISVAQLSRTQRKMLLNAPVNRVTVYGRVEHRDGQLLLVAEQLMPVVVTLTE